MGILMIKRLYMNQYEKTKHNLYFEVLRTAGIVNPYALVCEIASPDSIMLFSPISGSDSIEEVADSINSKLKGVEITTGVVTGNLVGRICLRRFDNEHAIYYKDLVDMKKIEARGIKHYDPNL